MAGAWPEAEVEVDDGLVRRLLAEQHPDLAGRPIRALSAGFDNTLWRLGDDLVVRLPRRHAAAVLTEHEQRWLPGLAARLPLPIPTPVRVGRPSDHYPWPWSVVPWLDGQPADGTPILRPARAARQLGSFLRCLHVPAPPGAPRNPFRGVPLAERAAAFEPRMAELASELDGGALHQVWERALAAPHPGPPAWVHGDLHPANVLVAADGIVAVIDFGDLCGGDPATDLAAAWMLLPARHLPAFATAYGAMDGPALARARGWAVLFGLLLLRIGLDGHPTYAAVARRTLRRAVADPLGQHHL